MRKKKRTTFVTLVLVLVVIAILSCCNGKDGCRDLEYLQCIENKTFTGHVIKTTNLIAPGLEECQMRCFAVHDCVSYNLGPINDHRRTCELSSSDHWTFHDALKDMKGHEYCPIKNPCSSKPCPPAKPLCYPDFAWDKHTCR
ncbi:uncharacterized protein LOC110237027, partial [Exaiptasia diaphana]|uniref:Apple domain-containing protein n=1 Tax=Exaiptasia diaphana TaxID=2652724 RepID=A0A913X456_EXADI